MSFQKAAALKNVNFSICRIGSPLFWRGVRGEAFGEEWSPKTGKLGCFFKLEYSRIRGSAAVSLSLPKGGE
jgi:hypothetical protein